MNIEEAISYMTTLYLERVVRSVSQDYPTNKGEKEYREIIKNNVNRLSEVKLIAERLDEYFLGKNLYSKQILYNFILKSLLTKVEYFASVDIIINDVKQAEKEIIEASKSNVSLKHLDEKSVNILSAILEVALENEAISKDELALISKLRDKLSINEKDQYLIQAQLELFPEKGNNLHTQTEIKKVIKDLQYCGIIFCCNQYDEAKEKIFVIPEEIISGLKKSLDIELIKDKFQKLLGRLTTKQLRLILDFNNLWQSGKKELLIDRIIRAGLKPTEVLELLSSKELSKICGKLPGVKKSGHKDERIDRIMDYYSNLIVKPIDNTEDPRKKYYEYLEELASQDLKNLLGNNIIKNREKSILASRREPDIYLKKSLVMNLLISTGVNILMVQFIQKTPILSCYGITKAE